MKRTILLLLLSFIGTSIVFAQKNDFKKPVYKKIEKQIKSIKSDYYYPELLEKYSNGGESMTLEEKRHLYYGFVFQSEYDPYGHSKYEDSLKIVMKKDDFSDKDIEDILKYSNQILLANPFNLKAIYNRLFMYDQTKNKEEFNKELTKYHAIFDAIFSSGDGLSKKSAFYVIDISHEYALVDLLDYECTGQALIDHYDYLEISENEYGIGGFYFDISPCLNKLSDMFK